MDNNNKIKKIKTVREYRYKIRFNKKESSFGVREYVTIKKIPRFQRWLIKWIIGWKMELMK